MGLKESVKNNPALFGAATALITFFGGNRITGRSGNTLVLNGVRLKRTRIEIHGHGNRIEIMPGSKLVGTHIHIFGNENLVYIQNGCSMYQATLYMEDDRNRILIGENSTIHKETELAAIEGTTIKVGRECLFSSEIDVRTGDSHSILGDDGIRINPSADVEIGDHVWIGTRAMILKGVSIAENCVVGAGSIVTRPFAEAGCALAGNPATAVKKGINWNVER